MAWFAAPLAPSLRTVFAMSLKGILRPAAIVVTAIRHRREVMKLDQLDDRALQDIGLVRADVEHALSEPYFRDPSAALVRSTARRPRVWTTFAERTVRPVVPVVKDSARR